MSQSHSEPHCWLYCAHVREASSSCLARVDLSGVLCDTMTLLNKWSPTEWSKWEAAAAEEWINRWKRGEWCRRPRVTLFHVAECAGVHTVHLPQSTHPHKSCSRILWVNKITLRNDDTANTVSCKILLQNQKRRDPLNLFNVTSWSCKLWQIPKPYKILFFISDFGGADFCLVIQKSLQISSLLSPLFTSHHKNTYLQLSAEPDPLFDMIWSK